jgi:hypothetical protein
VFYPFFTLKGFFHRAQPVGHKCAQGFLPADPPARLMLLLHFFFLLFRIDFLRLLAAFILLNYP